MRSRWPYDPELRARCLEAASLLEEDAWRWQTIAKRHRDERDRARFALREIVEVTDDPDQKAAVAANDIARAALHG